MEPGQLGEGGVRNLTALGNVVQWQKVHYDFQYHTAEFDCNLVGNSVPIGVTHEANMLRILYVLLFQPVMILSEGKSIINVRDYATLTR